MLKHYAEQESLGAMERQRIFRGVAKLVGGVMKACPVGQPYVGLGGDIASAVGDIDIADPKNLGKSIGDALGKVGGATDTFLGANQDLIADDVLKSDKARVRGETAEVESLTEQLARAKGASANLERSITARTKPIESAWTDEHKTEMESLKASIKETESTITTYSALKDPAEDEKKRLTAAREANNRLKARLGATEAATLTRQPAALGTTWRPWRRRSRRRRRRPPPRRRPPTRSASRSSRRSGPSYWRRRSASTVWRRTSARLSRWRRSTRTRSCSRRRR